MSVVLPVLYVDRALPPGFEDLFEGVADVVGPGAEALASAQGVIAGSSAWGPDELDACGPDVRVISRTGIGYDAIDVDAATQRGIAVCNAPAAPTVSTAEHAIALVLAACKDLSGCQARLRAGDADHFGASAALELSGRSLGLVGYGRIAHRVAGVGRALGMVVRAHDPNLDAADVPLLDLHELLSLSDVVSVHAPLTPETRGMFGADAFAAMKHGAVFVNTARGGLVDQAALVAALDEGRVWRAALDVTEPEPLPTDHPLLRRDDVVVTPHVASATDRGKRRLYEHAIGNALAVIGGTPPPSVLNPDVLA